MDDRVIRIAPFQYVHILDCNTILTSVVVGPSTYVLKDHERIGQGKVLKMIQIPPRNYCIIRNPALKDKDGHLVLDENGMVKVNFGDREVRTSESHPNPFPLYPMEEMEIEIQKIPIVQPNQALRLRAIRDFVDGDKNRRSAGDE